MCIRDRDTIINMSKIFLNIFFVLTFGCSSTINTNKTERKIESFDVQEVPICNKFKQEQNCEIIISVNRKGISYFENLKIVFENFLSENIDLNQSLQKQKSLSENLIKELNIFACSFGGNKNKVEDLLENKLTFEIYLKAVSYTHLDVYKRQHL